ncbi:MAG: hypothetical protein WKG07_29555 [Hymenobacter sp.]
MNVAITREQVQAFEARTPARCGWCRASLAADGAGQYDHAGPRRLRLHGRFAGRRARRRACSKSGPT